MAILSTLLSVAKPVGMWENIIWAFDSFTNNYIWAVVLITIIIRIIWSPLDTYNRRITSKNTAMQQKMQPELQRIQEKYGHDKQLLNQKTNEVYKKHNYNMAGSCGFMLIMMVLNLVVFFTLFAGLNKISNYKIYENYDFMKEDYANCLNVVNEHVDVYKTAINEGKELEFRVFTQDENKLIGLFEKGSENNNNPLAVESYLELEKFKERDIPELPSEDYVPSATRVIRDIVNKFKEDVLVSEVKDKDGAVITEKVTLEGSVSLAALPLIIDTYKAHQDKFLWIKNIWVADSPLKSSILDYNQFEGLVNKKNIEEGEDVVYNSFMPKLKDAQGKVNGYFILPLLIIAISFFSTWLSQFLMKKKNAKPAVDKDGKPIKPQGRIMQFIMPLIMGMFAIFYNAVFAIYMLASQLVSTLLMPLQNLIVKKFEEKDEKKAAQKAQNTMDYRRKQ